MYVHRNSCIQNNLYRNRYFSTCPSTLYKYIKNMATSFIFILAIYTHKYIKHKVPHKILTDEFLKKCKF